MKIIDEAYILLCNSSFTKTQPISDWEAAITTPPQCMPSRYKVEGDYVTAYRRYYVGEKIPRFATWRKGTPQPEWTRDSKYVVPQVKLTLCHKVS